MREILFKAKRVDNGKWVEGSYVYTFAPDKECPVVGVHKENHWIVEENGNIVIVDASTICRYTGLTDKNGKKIWENDIVKHFTGINIGAPHLYENGRIFWEESRCMFKILHFEYKETYFIAMEGTYEVIGNIFDNPELLEGGAK